MENKKKVVITGLGPVSPVGLNKDDFWDSLVNGRTNFKHVSRFPVDDCVAYLGAEVDVHVPKRINGSISTPPPDFKGLDIEKYVHPKTLRKVERFNVEGGGWSLYYGISAAKIAVEDAGLNFDEEDLFRVGCTVSAASGDIQLIRHARPVFELTQYGAVGGITGTICYEFGLQGVGIPLAGACASGSLSMRGGYMEIASGNQDVMLVGSVSAALASRAFFQACDQPRFGPMSKQNDEERPMKPFDVDRGGFVLGEGAGVLVIEELDHALARGAHIYAEIAGFGHSTDTATHMADVSIDGYLRAMGAARTNAGLTEEVLATKTIHFSTHGTATRKNDKIETEAIRQVFGENSKQFLVNSIKGTTGHAQEAASGHELIAACLVLERGIVPPTTGLVNLDPDCHSLDIVHGEARQADVDIVIKSASGFCGPYCTTVLKKYEG